ncbi:MAG: peptide-N-glycosidase F-related protein [Myxococcales bacterium]
MPESLGLDTFRWAGAAALWLALVACESKPLDAAPNPSGAGGASTVMGGQPGEIAGDQAGGASAGDSADALGEPLRVQVLTRAHISSREDAENFQHVLGDVDFGQESVARATLRVTLESPCFPFDGWAALGVPATQNWPAPCDAFDRTLSVTLDQAEPPSADAPGLELLRAITPFGGPLSVESDVTDVVNGLPGPHQLGLRIDTWSDADGLVSGSDGEWLASAELLLWPGTAPRQVLAVLPLVLGPQTEVDAAPVGFEVPEGANSARIDYRVTGHGSTFAAGCLGPAEEFCQRTHELRLDGELLSELRPWRDCSDMCTLTPNDSGYGPRQYCAENPCADPNSARAPRANWCPGSLTPPFELEAPALSAPGAHELTRSIQQLAPGGTWQVSATYFAFR